MTHIWGNGCIITIENRIMELLTDRCKIGLISDGKTKRLNNSTAFLYIERE